MARVRNLEQGRQSVRIHPTEVDCFHQMVQNEAGERWLHLSTFGSDDRSSSPKSSQSLQIDVTIARELIQVLRSVFPDLD